MMNKTTQIRSGLLLAALSMSISYQAQSALLTFDGPLGASAETYYEASDGVTFSGGGLLADGNGGGQPGQPQFVSYGGETQIGTLSKVPGNTYSDSFFDIWVNFDSGVTAVSGEYWGNLGSGGSVYAFDNAGTELGAFNFSAVTGSTSTVGILGVFDFAGVSGIESLHLISDSASASAMLDNLSYSPVPVPAAVWLFASGMLGLLGFARRKAS